MTPRLSLEIPLEDLVRDFPGAVGFLAKRGIQCIRCGEPLWYTLGELLEESGVGDPIRLLEELKKSLSENE